MSTVGDIRIGISGWRYPPWRGVFYPPQLPQRQELAFAAQTFRSVEINGTFYSLQRPDYFAAWSACTPDDFVFSVKGPRYITHMLKLNGAEEALANFFASGVLRLGPKLGPIFWQFPPRFAYNRDRLERFIATLPKTTGEACRVAAGHGERMAGRCWLETDADRPIRYAIEIRHESFRDPDFIALLRAWNVALIVADTVAWPRLMDVTADFIYCRLHGSEELYVSGYHDAELDIWAGRVAAWARGTDPPQAERVLDQPADEAPSRDVYVYFDNDAKVRAPFDAQGLVARVDHLLANPA